LEAGAPGNPFPQTLGLGCQLAESGRIEQIDAEGIWKNRLGPRGFSGAPGPKEEKRIGRRL
jgi:hypothetical protein